MAPGSVAIGFLKSDLQSSVNKNHNGSFPTRDEAEVAALEAAQAEIDLGGSLS